MPSEKTTKSLQDIALDFVKDRTESSFAKLYHRLKPGLRKMVQRYHNDPETIDDILAVTFSNAYVFVDKYDPRWNFSTWIYKICQNECLMELRRKNAIHSLEAMEEANIRVRPMDSEDWMEVPDYEYFDTTEELPADKVYDEIMDEMENLHSPYKEVMHDRLVGKLKYEEIAQKQGIPINTVRSRIHSAKKIVKNRWIEKKKAQFSNRPIRIKNVTTIDDRGLDDKTLDKSHL
jgi:RNA polymerase sigma-70 factor (ECF subfamily)